jgi:gliding motility-associated-like protein
LLNLTKYITSFSLGFLPRIKPVCFVVLLFTSFWETSKAQENLVPNGSFEEYNWCPSYTNGFYIDACKYWTSPTTGGSPDFFNACSTDIDSFGDLQFSVPNNYYPGSQLAHSGVAYAGIIFAQNEPSSPTYSEYLQIELISRLRFGKFYKLQFYINNSSISRCSNSIGALFTEDVLGLNTENVIPLTPQFQSDLHLFFCDTAKWYEMNYVFQADGTEKFLTIGVFNEMPYTYVIDENGFVQQGGDRYYYIDDVSLVELDYKSWIDGKIPNVITPNNDNINDVFTFDNEIVMAKKLTILNRWGNVVYQTEDSFSWDGTFNGNPCSEGVYYYLIEVTETIKTYGFLTLIR